MSVQDDKTQTGAHASVRIVPDAVLISRDGETTLEAVTAVRAHPPGQHPPGCPLVESCTAVELVTARGSRWWGFERAWIGSDLRMYVSGFDPRNEIVNAWDRPTP